MKKNNTMFTGGQPTWANACVGENGSPGYRYYAKGYSQASEILINTILIDKGASWPVDILVYPVCFNMRHSVELRLKDAISELAILGTYRGNALQFDLSGSHDIGNIWKYFIVEAPKIDDRYAFFIGEIGGRIDEFSKVDATGQTFRYPLDTDNKKHLPNITNINFVALRSGFTELESKLDNLHYFNKYMLSEYALGTFTKSLSRRNLFELAKYLPNRVRWESESFGKVKNFLKQVFKISSNELSNAIKIIEKHYELAPLIGVSIPLLGVERSDIDEFLYFWFQYHGFPSDEDLEPFDGSEWKKQATFEAVMEDAESRKKVWLEVRPNLTPEKLAGLLALHTLAGEDDFSESYKPIYENILITTKMAFDDSDNAVYSKYFHTYGRKSVGPNILRSLFFLKKSEEADYLVAKYNLADEYPWVGDARNRKLFLELRYCENAI